MVNNIAGIIDAFDGNEGTAIPLMLFGLFETAGRLSVAFSDIFKSRVARIFLLDAVLIALFVCCLVLAYDNLWSLNICVILVSYCYGFLYANVSAITADLFGVKVRRKEREWESCCMGEEAVLGRGACLPELPAAPLLVPSLTLHLKPHQHFGGNLGFTLFAPIIGSFGFASGIVDIFYVDGCTESACYRYVFLTEAVCCILATILCLFLKLRIMERFQVSTMAEIFQRNSHEDVAQKQ